ncbi:hypothetical protein AB0Y20_01410 [Heyndrickxia oleronia]|uniref:hypothetical protein n=1 Tax=Heyndrickxia oleronia TaxID=38875 RepID=UPI003F23057C
MIIFDEKQFAEKMLKSGFQTKHKQVYELNILSKYYFHQGKSDEEVKEFIVKFCEKHIDYFSMSEWYKIINKTIEITKSSKIITGKEVHITQKELDIIKQLEKLNEQKLAFVMLVLYKFYDYKKFEISIEDLFRLCKLNLNSQTKLKLLQSLTSKELIDITMGGKRFVKFADKKGKSVIEIKDFDDFIYEFSLYMDHEGFAVCKICNKAIKIRGKNHKRCRNCQTEYKRNYQREIMRKRRKGC